MRISAEQRRAALSKRTEKGVTEKDEKIFNGKSVLDFSVVDPKRIKKIVKYKIKSGKNINEIDILPFEITQDWYKKLRGFSGSPIGLEKGYVDYKLEIPVHKRVGEDNDSFLCLRLAFGKKCPICDEMFDEYKKEEDARDQKKISSLRPSWRCYYNVYDANGDENDIMLWSDVSYHLFEKFLKEAIEVDSSGLVTFSDLEEGATVEFKGRTKTFGKNEFVEAHSFRFNDREKYEEDILDETYQLDKMLVIPTYEEVANAYLGLDTEDENGQEDEKSDDKQERKRFSGRSKEPSEAPWDEEKIEEKKPTASTRNRSEKKPDICKSFGTGYNLRAACEECDEVTFQSCAAKQAELDDVKQVKQVKEETQDSPPSRRRRRG